MTAVDLKGRKVFVLVSIAQCKSVTRDRFSDSENLDWSECRSFVEAILGSEMEY